MGCWWDRWRGQQDSWTINAYILLCSCPSPATLLYSTVGYTSTMKRIEEKGDLFSFVDIVIARTRATAHSTSVPRRENPLSIRILQKNWIKKGKKKVAKRIRLYFGSALYSKGGNLARQFSREAILFIFIFFQKKKKWEFILLRYVTQVVQKRGKRTDWLSI